ncbi:MAG: oxaloacetate decarboxylase, partial [Planctomycetia bacterium]
MSTAATLRTLLRRPGLVRALAPHDAFTARILEQSGIELLFLGGFGAAASRLGLPDLGLLAPGEMAECIRGIADRVSIPLVADGDTGHGDAASVAWTIRAFEAAGAAGVLLEDQPEPKRCGHFAGKQVVPVATMLDRLRAALDARRDPDFVVIARTDSLAVEGIDAAIDRMHRYAEAGADMGFVEAPRSVADLARIARELPLPQLANMLPGGITPIVPLDELERMGFKVAVDPTSTLA